MRNLAEGGGSARKILVVAVGNPDRGDDGVGPLVAIRLAGRLPPDVALIVRRGDILSLIEDWNGCDGLVCVDAAAPMETPGRIHRIDAATAALPRGAPLASSHEIGLAGTIALAHVLQSLPEIVIVYAIEGACFDGGAPMTPAVVAAAAEAANRIVDEVDQLRWNAMETKPDA